MSETLFLQYAKKINADQRPHMQNMMFDILETELFFKLVPDMSG